MKEMLMCSGYQFGDDLQIFEFKSALSSLFLTLTLVSFFFICQSCGYIGLVSGKTERNRTGFGTYCWRAVVPTLQCIGNPARSSRGVVAWHMDGLDGYYPSSPVLHPPMVDALYCHSFSLKVCCHPFNHNRRATSSSLLWPNMSNPKFATVWKIVDDMHADDAPPSGWHPPPTTLMTTWSSSLETSLPLLILSNDVSIISRKISSQSLDSKIWIFCSQMQLFLYISTVSSLSPFLVVSFVLSLTRYGINDISYITHRPIPSQPGSPTHSTRGSENRQLLTLRLKYSLNIAEWSVVCYSLYQTFIMKACINAELFQNLRSREKWYIWQKCLKQWLSFWHILPCCCYCGDNEKAKHV